MTVEKSVVYRLAVFEQYHPQVFPSSLRDSPPSPDSTVRLDNLPHWSGDDPLDPFQLDATTVRPLAGMQEILRKSHLMYDKTIMMELE